MFFGELFATPWHVIERRVILAGDHDTTCHVDAKYRQPTGSSNVPIKKRIDRAVAKGELERINDVLDEPHVLIGGLAVQQFYSARLSNDIDLICDFQTAHRILDMLYPSLDWKVDDKQHDEYRPSFRIEHKVEDLGTVIFGPKISERAPYSHIDWDTLKDGAHKFQTANGLLENILVPPAHALAYTKFISFLGRQSPEDKIEADLKDFADLTNHERFSVSLFYDFLRKSKSATELISNFRAKSESYRDVIGTSCLYDIASLFSPMRTPSEPAIPTATSTAVYIAAPHKNVSKNSKLKTALMHAGFVVKLPFEEVSEGRITGGADQPDAIRSVCIQAIKESQLVVVDLDTYGLDTAWEIGYAEGLGKRVVGYNEDVFLAADERPINRRRYEHNFMHGWERQAIFARIEDASPACVGKTVYVVGAFANAELESALNDTLVASAGRVIFPKHHIDNQNRLPKDYPLAERGETNRLLEDADVILVVLPRYGMDSSWQIGFATAKEKTIIGVVLKDDGVELGKQSYWDHWMHAWKSKVRTTGVSDLCSVLRGFALQGQEKRKEEGPGQ